MFNHRQGSDAVILQHGPRRIAQTKTADEHVQMIALNGCQSEICQRDLGRGEQARHQMLVAKDDLEDIHIQRHHPAAAQTDRPNWRFTIVEFFKQTAHGAPF